MRPDLTELCGINPKELMLLPHYEAEKKIIDACYIKRDELANKMDAMHKGEGVEADDLDITTFEYMYLDKAITGRVQDYELMGLEYRREK